MLDFVSTLRQVGIRQRSLKRHCRLGRATELVFVLATGAALVIGGEASAQASDLRWDGAGLGTANPAAGGSGDWGPGDYLWPGATPQIWQNITLGFANDVFVDGDDVTFGGVAGTVTVLNVGANEDASPLPGVGNQFVLGQVDATSVVFQTTGYVLNGAAFAVSSGIAADTGVTATINAAIAGNVIVGSVSRATVTAPISSDAGTIILNGGVSGSVSKVSVGTLVIGGGTVTGSVTTSGGTTRITGGTVSGNVTSLSAGSRTELAGGTYGGNLILAGGTLAIAQTLTIADLSTVWTGTSATLEVSNGGDLIVSTDFTQGGARLLDVKSGGTITIPTLTVSSGAALSNAGTFNGDVYNAGPVTLSGGTLNGILVATGTSTTTVTGNASVTQEIIALSSNGLIVNPGVTLTNAGGMTLGNGAGTDSFLLLQGSLAGNLTVKNGSNAATGAGAAITGDVTLEAGSNLWMSGNLSLTGNVTQTGTIENTTATAVTLTHTGGTFTHSGVLNGGALPGASLIMNVSNYTLSGGTILNTVTGLPSTLLTITGGNTDVNANISTDIYVDATGIMTVTGNSTVGDASNGVFDVENDGIVTVNSGVTLTASSFDNDAALNLNGALALTVDGTNLGFANRNAFVNSGTVAFGAGAALSARDRVENEAGSSMTFAGNATITADTDSDGVANAETFINAGTINLSGGTGTVTVTSPNDVTMTNTATGALTVGTGWTLDVSGMNSGSTQDLTNSGTLTMSGGTITGTVQNSGTLAMNSGTIDGTVYNTSATGLTLAGGHITGGLDLQGGTTTVNVTGDARVTGQMGVRSGATVNVQSGNTLRTDYAAVIESGGTVTVNGTLDGRALLRNGVLNLNGDIVATQTFLGNLENMSGFNSSQINVTGDSLVAGLVDINGGALDVASGVNFTVNNPMDIGTGGALNLNGGTITGSVNNAGTADLFGTITGAYTQTAGTTTIDGGDLSVTGATAVQDGTLTVASTRTLTATGGLTVGDGTGAADSAVATISGSVAGDITIAADGKVVANNGSAIGNANTVTVNGGELQLTQSETIGALAGSGGDVTLSSASILTAGGNNASTSFGGVIAGAGGLIKAGTGTLTLTGANTYIGMTQISAGTLALTGSGTLSNSGTITVNNGAALSTDGFALGGSANVQLLASGSSLVMSGGEGITSLSMVAGSTVQFSNNAALNLSGNSTLSGTLTGTGRLAFTGGVSTLSGANTFSGPVNLSNATLTLSGGAAINDAAILTVTNSTVNVNTSETISSLSGSSGTVNLNGAGIILTLSGGDFSGAINGDGALVKNGLANMNLGGTNLYTGTTTVNAGNLNVSGSLASSAITVNGGTYTQTAGAQNALINAGGIVGLNGGTVNSLTSNSGSAELRAGAQVLGTTTINGGYLFVNGTAGGLQETQAVNVTGTGSFLQNAGEVGAITSSGDEVSLIGGTASSLTLNAGIAIVSGGQVTGATAVNAGTLSMIGTTGGPQELAGVSVASGATFNASAGEAGAVTNAGAFTLGGTATMASVTQSGGSMTMNGGTVSGPTAINGGSFTVSSGANATVSSQVTVGSGASPVAINGTLNGSISSAVDIDVAAAGSVTGTLTNSATGSSNAGTVGTLTNTAGTFANTGSVTTATNVTGGVLTNSGTLTGTATVSGGELNMTGGTAGAVANLSGGTLDIDGGSTGAVTNAGLLELGGGTVASVTQSAGTTTVDGSTTVTGAMAINAGNLNVNAGQTLTAGSVANGGILDLNGTIASNVTNTGAANITGGTASAFTQNTSGSLTIDAFGTGTVTNAFTMNGGNLTLGESATLQAGSFNLNGFNILNLGDNSSFVGTGNTFNLGFALSAPAGFSITDTGAINVNNGGALTFSAGGTLTADGDGSGGEGINVNAGGTLSATGSTLTLNTGGTGGVNVASGGTLTVNNATLAVNSDTVPGPSTLGTIVNTGTTNLSGATVQANFTQNAGGTLNVTGNSTITGTTTINDGTLNVAAGQTLTANLVFGGTASNVQGTINGDLTVNSGQTIIATGDLQYNTLRVNSGGTFTTLGNVDIVGATNTTTIIDGAAVYNNGDTLNDNGSIIVGFGALGATVQLNTGAGGAIEFDADDEEDGNGTIRNAGTITVTGTGTVTMGDGAAGDDNFLNASAATSGFGNGVLDIAAGAAVDGIAALTNESTLANAITIGAGGLLDVVTLNSTAGTITTAGEIDGNVALSGANAAALVVNNDDVVTFGAVDGNLSTAGDATFDVNGALGGTVEVTGTLTQGSTGASTFAGDVTGIVTVADGSLTVDGASAFANDLDVNGGAVNVNANLGVTGATSVDGGTLTIAAAQTMTGSVTAGAAGAGGSVIVNGALVGALEVQNLATFDINAGGSVSGTVFASAAGGTSQIGGNVGNLNITNGNVVTITDSMTNAGVTFVDGGGTLDVAAGAVYTAAGGPVQLGFDNANPNLAGQGNLNVLAGGSVAGNVNVFNGGQFLVQSGGLTEITGNVEFFNTATDTSFLAGDIGGNLVMQTGNSATLTVNGTSTVGGFVDINGGTVNVNAGLTATGAVTLDGAATMVVADGQTLTTNGGLTVGGTTAGATLDVNGSIAGSGITVTDGTLLLGDGAGTTTVAGTVQFDAGTFTLTGPVDIAGTLDINGGTTSMAGAITANDIDIAAGAGTIGLAAGGSLVADATTLANAATLNVGAGGTLGATTTLTNTGAITFANAGALNGVTVSNSGTLTVTSGAVTSTATTVNNLAGGSMVVNGGGSLTFGAGTLTTANGSAITLADNGTLSAGVMNLQAGTTAILGNSVTLASTTGALTNGTTLAFGTSGTLSSAAALTNNGAVSFGAGGTLTAGGVVTNGFGSTLTFSNGGTLNSTGTIQNTGSLNVGGTVAVGGDALNNNAFGSITVNAGGTLNGITTLTSFNGSGVTVGAGGTLSANTIDLQSGTNVNVTAANVTVEALTGSFTNSGNLMSFGSDGILRAATTLSNTGTINMGANGTLEAGTILTNGGAVTFANGGALNAASIQNNGSLTVTTGTVTSNGAAFNNNAPGATLAINGGALNGLGLVTNASTSVNAITVASGATLNFTMLNSSAGTITSAGTLSGGPVSLTGNSILDLNGGTVTGNLTHDSTGTTTLAGTLGGRLDVNAGQVTVDGNTSGATQIDIDGGNLVINSDQSLSGQQVFMTSTTVTLQDATAGNTTTLASTAGPLTNQGTVNAGGGAVIQSVGGQIDNRAGGVINFNNTGAVTTSQLISGVGPILNRATINVNAGTVTTANSSYQADGAIFASNLNLLGGSLDLGTGTFTDTAGTGAVTVLTVAGDASGAATLTAASMTLSESQFDLDSTVDAATLAVGTVTLDGAAQASQLFGTITGAVDVNGGTLTVDGTSAINGAVTVDNASLIVNDAVALTNAGGTTIGAGGLLDLNGDLAGNVVNTSGTVQLGDASGTSVITGSFSQTGAGTTTIIGNTNVTGPMSIALGDLTVNAATALNLTTLSASNTLTVDTNATFTNNGTVIGAVLFTGSGAANINGVFTNLYTQNDPAGTTTVVGASSFLGGFVNTAGQFTVNAPLTLGAASSNAGTLDINADVLGGQTITNTGTVSLASANFGGSFTQDSGTTTVDGATDLSGIFTANGGTVNVLAGITLEAGTFDFNAGSQVNLFDGSTLRGTANTHLIGGTETVLGATANFVETTGNIILEGTGSILLQNNLAQTLNVSLLTAGKTFTANAGSVINMVDSVTADTSDVVVINGDAVLNGIIRSDVNISGNAVGAIAADTADRVTVTGTASGTPTLALQNVSGSFGNIAAPVNLITASNTAGVNASLTGLPTGGSYVYSLNNTGSAVQLVATPNLAFGGVVSGVAATQSLISTVVNRPSSALVTPLVNPGDDPCANGTWARVTGGKANAKLGTRSLTTNLSSTNDIDLSYGGIQMGMDNSCSGGYYNGWDLAYGAMLGTNMGKTTLPVMTGSVSTTVKSDFDQLFGGVYLSGAKGNWFGDINLRADRTTYSLSETNTFGLGGLGLQSQKFDSHGRTVSGSLSYSHTLNAEKNIRLVPTLGFSISNIRTDAINITNDPTNPADDAVLQIADINQRIGFIGATLAQTKVQPSGDAALTYFVTGTYFKDFGDSLASTFTVTSTGAQQKLVSENLGGFGELSLGLNYTKIMPGTGALGLRQMDASVRADTRFSDQLDSWGLTAQVRLQF